MNRLQRRDVVGDKCFDGKAVAGVKRDDVGLPRVESKSCGSVECQKAVLGGVYVAVCGEAPGVDGAWVE